MIYPAARRPLIYILPVLSIFFLITPTSQFPARADAAAGNPPTPSTAPGGKTDGPRLVLPITSQKIDKIQGGEEAHYSFEVHNEGTQDLKITDVHPSCGCTVPSFDPSIPPGKTGTIKATVHTQPFWTTFTKELTVYSNDPAQPRVELTLVGAVIPLYMVTPATSLAVPYEKVEPITRIFTIQLTRPGAKLKIPPATQGPVTVQVEPQPSAADTWKVTMTLTPPDNLGNTTGEADFETDAVGTQPIHLMMVGLGQKGITVTPERIGFGSLAAGTARGMVTLFSQGLPFHITRVESDDPALKVEYVAVPLPYSFYNVSVIYAGGWKPGKHSGTISFYTDSQKLPVVKAPYSADVQ